MSIIKIPSFEIDIYSKGDKNSEKLALVLPGKLDTKDYAHMISHVNSLSSLGFFALSFDPPGTWESPGDISLYNNTNYLKTVNEVIEYFGNKPTFIMGHSRGASISMIATTDNPIITSYAAVMPGITRNSITSKRTTMSMRDLPPGGGEKVKKFELPESFHEDELKYKLTDKIFDCAKPKLFILGTRDVTVPTDELRREFDNFSLPKEKYEMDSDHDYRSEKDKIDEVNDIVKKFLEKYNLL